MHEMREFFQSLNELYRQQIQGRMVTGPADAVFPRLQNIWGRDFVLVLLATYYSVWPPRSVRVDLTLEQLPPFIHDHPYYAKVLGLYDMTVLCLQMHRCLYGPDPEPVGELPTDLHCMGIVPYCFFHYPVDRLQLGKLWQESATPLVTDPWLRLQTGGGSGCIFIKISCDECLQLPLTAPLVPLLEALDHGYSLHQALTSLDEDEADALQDLLADSISLWQQAGLLTTLASVRNLR